CRIDGAPVSPGDACCHLNGSGQDIVTLERTLLNFLQRLSGVATMTQQFVRALDDPNIHILDTRKTTPLLRHLEKQAVVAGGGHNHRQGLYDMILVKENHLISYINTHGIAAFNHQLTTHKKTHPNILIEVEVAEISLLSELDLTPIDIIMFDNMSLTKLTRGLRIIQDSRATILTEVSGNIDLDTIHQYRGVPIDRISIGRLTHSVNALDLSLLVQ
ncbi:MAG: carboxylating nicotinate-nucleotide diphosphorylase, partial [Candidatus Marinamargulisbacteria bacterium]